MENRQPSWVRIVLLILAVPNIITGLWAVAAPQNFFDTFPGWAPALVAAHPPFNEHLTIDAGSGLFASGVLALAAAVWMRRDVIVVAMIGFLAFALPHAVFHLLNPAETLTTPENASGTGPVVIAVGLALAVLVSQRTPTPLAEATRLSDK